MEKKFRLLWTGDDALDAMLRAIQEAKTSIRLEMYIYRDSPIGNVFRMAMIEACARGVKVQVLNDALGAYGLPKNYWDSLVQAGGEFRWFNPIKLKRLGLRDHRKIQVCDDQVAFIGGFNIAPEYNGDGVTHGWRDLGLEVHGALVEKLALAFDSMFARAEHKLRRFPRFRREVVHENIPTPDGELLLSGPGRGFSPIKERLRRDLAQSKSVRIICAYFLPTWRLRRYLMSAARQGARIQLILAGKSDVPLMQLASQSLYLSLLRAGIEIYEYQPQILHAKMVLIGDIVYLGSANLDTRSLHINYELLVRLEDKPLAREADDMFDEDLAYSKRVELKEWKASRTLWRSLKERWAYFILARVDPYLSRLQIRLMRMPAVEKRTPEEAL